MENTLPFAPLWRRLMSLCYEAFLAAAIITSVGFVAYFLFSRFKGTPLTFFLVMAVLFWHFSWCWRRSGQTLAMKVWRLRLLSVEDGVPSLRAVAIRFGIIVSAFLPLTLALLLSRQHPEYKRWIWLAGAIWVAFPYLWALVDKQRQFLQDRLAGTKMVLVPIVRSVD